MAEPGHVRRTGTHDSTTGELVKKLSEQVSDLIRSELRLAQAELAEKGRHAGLGVGMFGASGLVALFGIGTLLAAAVLALALVLPAWAAALIVGAVLLIAAGVLALVGRKEVGKAAPAVPEQASVSVRADVEEIKERARR